MKIFKKLRGINMFKKQKGVLQINLMMIVLLVIIAVIMLNLTSLVIGSLANRSGTITISSALDYLTSNGYTAWATGGLTTNQVPYANSSTTLAGDSGLTYNPGTDTLTTTNISAPTGRSATYVIAASNATALEKAQADVVCDGTDDDVQINDAISKLSSGGTIQLSSGTFTVNAQQTFYPVISGCLASFVITTDNLTIQGTGNTNIVLQAGLNVGSSYATIFNVKNCNYFKLLNVKLNANTANITAARKYCVFIGSSGAGHNANYGVITGCYMTGVGTDGSSGLIYGDATSFNSGTQPYDAYWDIYDNIFVPCGNDGSSNGGVGVAFHNTPSFSNFHHNQILNAGYIGIGLLIDSVQDCIFSNNYIRRSNDSAVVVFDTPWSAGVSTVENKILIESNIIENYGGTKASTTGIYVQRKDSSNYPNGIKIINNMIDNIGVGVKIDASCLNTIVKGNKFTSTVTTPISDSGVTTTIFDNTGYIAPGEIRTYSGAITATALNTSSVSLLNPFGQNVRVINCDISVTVVPSSTSYVDVGIGTTGADSTGLFTKLDMKTGTAPLFNRASVSPGTLTLPLLWNTTSYFNIFTTNDAATTGMTATYTVTVMGN